MLPLVLQAVTIGIGIVLLVVIILVLVLILRTLRDLRPTLQRVEKAVNEYGKTVSSTLFRSTEELHRDLTSYASAIHAAATVTDSTLARVTKEVEEAPPRPQVLEYGEDVVRELYAAWCMTDTVPSSSSAIEIVSMWQLNTRRQSELDPLVHVFEDAEGVAEWVRFAPVGGSDGLLFPNPSAALAANALTKLFGTAGAAAASDRAALAALEPVHICRTSAREWETCQQ